MNKISTLQTCLFNISYKNATGLWQQPVTMEGTQLIIVQVQIAMSAHIIAQS